MFKHIRTNLFPTFPFSFFDFFFPFSMSNGAVGEESSPYHESAISAQWQSSSPNASTLPLSLLTNPEAAPTWLKELCSKFYLEAQVDITRES
jgi:hypothetical protein